MIFFKLESKHSIAFILPMLLAICLYSCKNNNSNSMSSKNRGISDTVYIEQFRIDTVHIDHYEKDTIFVCDRIVSGTEANGKEVSFILQPAMYDSAATRKLLDKFLWMNTIENYTDNGQTELYTRTDLEYLPYLLLLCNNSNNLTSGNDLQYVFMSLCAECIDDKRLFDLGKQIIEQINKKRKRFKIEYPDEFSKGYMETFRMPKMFEPTTIDTLRVRVVAHNDRKALKKLEKYYLDKNDGLGIAIYYKVLLGYEGNGDLAEKFYRVLEPYFEKTPQLRSAVREVLLRAAICDHNDRAQQLCDSLGFSLCDYRLPEPGQLKY